MSRDENSGSGELSGWAQRLEAGTEDEATLVLATRLREERPAAPEPPAEFTAELRRQLLDQYERRPALDLRGLGRLVESAVALGLLTLAVLVAWLAMAQRPGAANNSQNTVIGTHRDARVIYDRLQVGLVAAGGEFVAGTAEFWQSDDGRLFRGQILDRAGNLQAVVVSDGRDVTYGMRVEPAGRNWFMEGNGELTYTVVENVEISVDEKAPHPAVLTLYRNLDWEGVVQAMIRPDWHCSDYICVINQVSHPAPEGIQDAFENGCSGWGSSLIDTESWVDGRQADIIQISYGCSAVITHEEGVPPEELDISPAAPLPQHRIIKVDPDTFELLEVSDYEGDTVLRSIRRLERRWLNPADLPADLFSTVPIDQADNNGAAAETSVEQAAFDSVGVLSVTPGPKTTITGTTTFEVQLAYNLASLPEAVITVTIAEKSGSTGGRGIASNSMTVQRGQAQLTILVPFNSAGELSGPASLALIVRMQSDERSTPLAVDMPDAYQWRYEP